MVTPIQKQPAINWGVRYRRALEYRDILEHHDRVRAIFPNITITESFSFWKQSRAGAFLRRLENGWAPHLVTDGFDILPFTRLDLRAAALRHDIAYGKGGGKEEKLDADIQLRADIIAAYPRSKYAWLVAWIVFCAVRTWFSRSHFNWGPRINGLPEYEHDLEEMG